MTGRKRLRQAGTCVFCDLLALRAPLQGGAGRAPTPEDEKYRQPGVPCKPLLGIRLGSSAGGRGPSPSNRHRPTGHTAPFRTTGLASTRLHCYVTCNPQWRQDHVRCRAQVVAREGSSISRTPTPTGDATTSDLGPRRPFAGLPGGGTPPVAYHRDERARGAGPGIYRLCLGSRRRVKRGEVWTVAGGADYAGKPRPAVIVQDDDFDATQSITICVFTTNPIEAPLFRVRITPDERNGLRVASSLMVDKITTVSKQNLRTRIGTLDDADIVRINQAMLVFLGLARPTRSTR
jgi:mRNA interferase MazF